MKIKFLKLQNWLLASAMGLFGLQACHSQKDVVEPEKDTRQDERIIYKPMYGVPERDYRVQSDMDTNDRPRPREPQVTVYGVPTVDFALRGRVVNKKGRPVKGVHVMLVNSEIDTDNLPDTEYWLERLRQVSDTTDADGNFEVRTSDRPWEKIRVMVRDIDGGQNGTFEQQILDVDFGEPQNNNRPISSWNLGERNAEMTIKINPKK